ncbi:MAG: tripartite tricarboxylate transporter TctB family protein [Peptococcales bacterium]|jgi:hypothetical protein
MKKREAYFYLGLMVACLIYLYSTVSSLPLGTIKSPGPGFVPLLIGSGAFVLSAFLFAASLKSITVNAKTSTVDKAKENSNNILMTDSFKKIMLFIVIMVIYIYLFDMVNFFINTFVMMVLLAKLFSLEGWIKPILMSGGFVGSVYIIFTKLFKIYF